MKLWELMLLSVWIPAFWFGWMWLYRVGVVAIGAQTVKGMIGQAASKIKGDDHHG